MNFKKTERGGNSKAQGRANMGSVVKIPNQALVTYAVSGIVVMKDNVVTISQY